MMSSYPPKIKFLSEFSVDYFIFYFLIKILKKKSKMIFEKWKPKITWRMNGTEFFKKNQLKDQSVGFTSI